jgi:hypothetical protein
MHNAQSKKNVNLLKKNVLARRVRCGVQVRVLHNGAPARALYEGTAWRSTPSSVRISSEDVRRHWLNLSVT